MRLKEIKEEQTALIQWVTNMPKESHLRQVAIERIKFLEDRKNIVFDGGYVKAPLIRCKNLLTGKTYESIQSAAKDIGLPIGTIYRDVANKIYKYHIIPVNI